MSVARIAVAAALLVATAATGAVAEARPAVLTLSGTGAAYTDVTFRTPVSIVPMHLAGVRDMNDNPLPHGWSWEGCGGVRGFYLRPLHGDPMGGVGAVDFAALRFGPASDLPLPGGPVPRVPVPLGRRHLDVGDGQGLPDDTVVRLPAGRYRAFVLGEGRCRVRVPLGRGARSVTAAARTRAAMQWAVRPLQPVATPGVPAAPLPTAGSVSVPLTVRPTTFSLALLHHVDWTPMLGPVVPSAVTYFATCVEADERPLCSAARGTPTGPLGRLYHHKSFGRPPDVRTPDGTVSWFVASTGALHVGYWHAPGSVPAGPHLAKVTAATTNATAQQAVAFALDL